MSIINFILSVISAGVCAMNYATGNTGMAIWMGFLAIANLMLAMNGG